MATDTLKEKLRSGQTLMGFEIDLTDPSIAEMASRTGFDCLWIDMEHEAVSLETVEMEIIACAAGSAASVVRIPWNESYLAKRVLEMGPDGIIFPMVNSAEEAKKAMDACLYPPMGKRGFGPKRCCDYGREDMNRYIEEAPERLTRFIQVEHIDAVRNLDEILKVPYLDGIIVGPCDLSGSIGLLNDIYNPKVLDLIDEVVGKCRACGMPVGIAVGTDSAAQLQFWLEKGFQFIFSGLDLNELSGAMKRRMDMMNEARAAVCKQDRTKGAK